MSVLDPQNTSIGDVCKSALRQSGAFGKGQIPSSDDVVDAWAMLQWMLMQWQQKRWMVYHLVNLSLTSTGATSYSIGPGGDFDTGAQSQRPSKLEFGFTRQINTSQPNQIDYHWGVLQSREDYDRITLKSLTAGPGEYAFLDSGYPLSYLYVWPIPQASVYELHPTIRAPLPYQYATLASTFTFPGEYIPAMVYPLALHLRPKYRIGTFPGDMLPAMAKDALQTVRTPNTQISKLRMPPSLQRRGAPYNIFSDRP